MATNERMTREQQHMVGRVMNRLRCKPMYMKLKDIAEVWGYTVHYVSVLSDAARAPLVASR